MCISCFTTIRSSYYYYYYPVLIQLLVPFIQPIVNKHTDNSTVQRHSTSIQLRCINIKWSEKRIPRRHFKNIRNNEQIDIYGTNTSTVLLLL